MLPHLPPHITALLHRLQQQHHDPPCSLTRRMLRCEALCRRLRQRQCKSTSLHTLTPSTSSPPTKRPRTSSHLRMAPHDTPGLPTLSPPSPPSPQPLSLSEE